jgi:hypothetical protein
MKINIYAEDLTHNWEVTTKVAKNGNTYIGVTFALGRNYTASGTQPTPNRANHVTLWATKHPGARGQFNCAELAALLGSAAEALENQTHLRKKQKRKPS